MIQNQLQILDEFFLITDCNETVFWLCSGHVDFYMNGGLRQPNCDLPKVADIKSVADLASYPIESKLKLYSYF